MEIEFPDKLQPLFTPARYKILYGGRGGAKSWGIARALLLRAAQQSTRVLCAREFQKSIGESVHKLLSDQIYALGLDGIYEIQKASIKCITSGSEFFFEGIKHNTQKIKSYEGIDVCWVEEAALVSQASWNFLTPTIRKEASEIWVSFNPDLESDATYQRFVLHPPAGAILIKINWRDNPFFPSVLRTELEELKASNYEEYLTVWEGHCRQALQGAVYAKELASATLGERICQVPYDRLAAVDTFWDLGRADKTSIWFGQKVGFQYRLIDYYENSQFDIDHYLQYVQGRGYTYGTHWLPHDAKAKVLGTKRTIEEQTRKIGQVRIVPKLSIIDGISAARQIFANCWFDKVKCEDGIEALRHYRYEVTDGKFSNNPVHDGYSHGADAFRYLAVALQGAKEKRTVKQRITEIFHDSASVGTGWMG